MTTLGSNRFHGVLYPVVINDRYFRVYEGKDNRTTLDVFRWDPTTEQRKYEVKAGQPLDDMATTNPTGIITFGTDDTGFLFKFRPDSASSHIFGGIPAADGVTVRITDRELHVSAGERVIVTLSRNSISNCAIGIHITPDGIGMGSNALPPQLLEV